MQTSIVSELIMAEGTEKSRLIPILNALQDHHGYLPADEIKALSEQMNLSISKIWGVMTFYSHYKLEPPSKYNIRVCTGTACHVKNSQMLRQKFEQELGNMMDVYVENVACLGCCALAPIFEINGEINAAMTTKRVFELVKEIQEDVLHHD